MAIYGKNFCTSSKDAFLLLMRNVIRSVMVDVIIIIIILICFTEPETLSWFICDSSEKIQNLVCDLYIYCLRFMFFHGVNKPNGQVNILKKQQLLFLIKVPVITEVKVFICLLKLCELQYWNLQCRVVKLTVLSLFFVCVSPPQSGCPGQSDRFFAFSGKAARSRRCRWVWHELQYFRNSCFLFPISAWWALVLN